MLPRSPAATVPLNPANRQRARGKLQAHEACLQNADKLLLFIRDMDEGLWGALKLQDVGFLYFFSNSAFKNTMLLSSAFAANIPPSLSLPPFLLSSDLRNKVRSLCLLSSLIRKNYPARSYQVQTFVRHAPSVPLGSPSHVDPSLTLSLPTSPQPQEALSRILFPAPPATSAPLMPANSPLTFLDHRHQPCLFYFHSVSSCAHF